MASTNIKTVAGRSKLLPRREPYWERIGEGRYLGFRFMTTGKPGSWVARYYDEASGKKPTKAMGDLSEHPDARRFDIAKGKAEEWFTHLGRGGSAKAYTVGDAIEAYVAYAEKKSGKVRGRELKNLLARLVPADSRLYGTEMEKLTPGHVKTWREGLPLEGKSRSTANKYLMVMRAALNMAHKSGWVTSSHAWVRNLAPVGGPDGARDVYLTRPERESLLAHCPADLTSFIRCLCLLPIRPGAAAALKVGDFDPRRGTLKITKDKAGAGRTIPLAQSTAEFLMVQAKDKLPTAYLFTEANGNPWRKDRWKVPTKQAVHAAGLNPNTVIYTMRHSVITDLILAGLDTLTVAKIAGTSLQQIEKHYGHLVGSRARDALATLAA